MTSPLVYAIIVNWNRKKDTTECLSFLKSVRKNQQMLSVVVVDNGSIDGSLDELSKKFPWAHYIDAKENLGFAGANNIGIMYAKEQKAEYIWLLNNDTVVDKNVLRALLSFRDPSVGAVGSKIYFYKGCEFHKNRYEKRDLGKVLWYAGGTIDWNNMLASHRGVDEVDHGQYDKEESTDFITGCSFFVRTSVIDQIGLMDDSYFMYMEDLDFSIRIQKGGFKTVYNPASIVWHKNASSSDGPGSSLHEYYQTRNRLKIGMDYAPLRTKLALIKEGIRVLAGAPSINKRGVLDFIKGAMGQYHE